MVFSYTVRTDLIRQDGVIDSVASALETGIVDNGQNLPLYAHRPDELRGEIASAGFSEVRILAVEGGFLESIEIADRLADPISRKALLNVLSRVEGDPGIVGIAGKLMAVARAPEGSSSDASRNVPDRAI